MLLLVYLFRRHPDWKSKPWLIDVFTHRPNKNASGLDGWLNLFTRMPRADQRWGTPPEALNHVPNPCLGKSDGECPTHQQRLSVLSVWLYAWSVHTYRILEGAEASVDASSKFRRRCACRNQRRLFQLLHDEPNGQCATDSRSQEQPGTDSNASIASSHLFANPWRFPENLVKKTEGGVAFVAGK